MSAKISLVSLISEILYEADLFGVNDLLSKINSPIPDDEFDVEAEMIISKGLPTSVEKITEVMQNMFDTEGGPPLSESFNRMIDAEHTVYELLAMKINRLEVSA